MRLIVRENQGAAALIDTVADRLPDALVVSDLSAANAAAVLSVAGRRDFVVADFESPDARAAVLGHHLEAACPRSTGGEIDWTGTLIADSHNTRRRDRLAAAFVRLLCFGHTEGLRQSMRESIEVRRTASQSLPRSTGLAAVGRRCPLFAARRDNSGDSLRERVRNLLSRFG